MAIAKKIVLKPIGGLCNRLRTLDSFITICKEKKIDLDVLWALDQTLNSSFFDLFENFTVNDFKLRIIDCPKGFPETNLIKIGKSQKNGYKIDMNQKAPYPKNLVKSLLANLGLGDTHRQILKELKELNCEFVWTNDEFMALYSSETQKSKTIREMDADYFQKIAKEVEDFISQKSDTLYVENCQRIVEMTSNYKYLKPVDKIRKSIEKVTSKFSENTIGLHIRRTDHVVAKGASTEKKFIDVVGHELEKNPKSQFFISTDDPITKNKLKDTFGDKILSHEVASYSRDDKNAIVDAVVDLYCLSKTNKIYGSHQSSFSQTAADLTGQKEIIL